MRFSYAESMCDPAFYVQLARAVEQAGYTSFVVPDSLGFPEHSDTKYPYTPDGDSAFLEGKPFLEPFSLIPALGAVTERLRFTTFVLKLPVRLPYLVAKSATSVAVLTNNRLGLGVGTSPGGLSPVRPGLGVGLPRFRRHPHYAMGPGLS